MEAKKESILAVYQILLNDSDEKHPISQAQFIELLKSRHGIEINRKTLYQNIDMLIDFGVQISDYNQNHKGYYLIDRAFDPGEIFFLCNAIYSSRYIPSDHSKDLIKRVLQTQSRYTQADYVFVENDRKKENKEFFLNLELLASAIKRWKSVTFDYTKYDLNKKLVKKRAERYSISPYLLIQLGDRDYLVGRSNNHIDHMATFRVDKIKAVKIHDDIPYIPKDTEEDPYEYAKNNVYMYDGTVNTVTIKCDNKILDDVIDIFGKCITIKDAGNDQFIADVKSSKQGMVYLALQYINHMEVLSPADYRKEVEDAIKDGVKKYKIKMENKR